MLERVWHGMNDAIPRLIAENQFDAYSVAVAASPDVKQQDRESIIRRWQMAISDAVERAAGAARISWGKVDELLRDAFGPQIRE